MKFYIFSLLFINLTLVLCQTDCENLVSFLKKNGYSMTKNCCEEPGIKCENDNIMSIDITLKSGKIDFSFFPIFSYLDFLSIKGDVFGGILELDDFNGISTLDFSNSSIKEVYDSSEFLFYDKKLILDNNKISSSFIVNVSELSLKNNTLTGEFIVPWKVRYLYIDNNQISSIRNEENRGESELEELYASKNNFDDKVFEQLKSFKVLQKLILSENRNINSVTESIGELSELKYLDLSNNNIKELHSNIFVLTDLETFNISENRDLSTRIINFASEEPIINCNFTNTETNILCYQPNTCKYINNNYYNICTDDEIKNVKRSQTLKPKGLKTNLTIIYIAFINIALIFIFIYIFMCSKKSVRRNDNNNNNNNNNNNYYYNNNRNDDDDILPPYEEGNRLPSYRLPSYRSLPSNDHNNNNSNNNNSNNNNSNNNNVNHNNITIDLPTYEEAVSINNE